MAFNITTATNSELKEEAKKLSNRYTLLQQEIKERFKENYRYYLPEEEAKLAEKELFKQNTEAYLEFSLPTKGEPLIKNFFNYCLIYILCIF